MSTPTELTTTKKVKPIKPLEQAKLLFSSLFGRQMTMLIVGGDEKENVFYLSNITLDEIDMYEQDATKYVHKISIFSTEIMDALYEVCPLFKDHVLLIDTKAFLGALNKEAKNEYHFEVTPQNKVILTTPEKYYEVGDMISTFIASMYVDLFEQSEIVDENHWELELTKDMLNDDKPNIIDIYNNKNKDMHSKAIITPCKNIVCLKEYLVKSKCTDWLLHIKAYGERSIKIECVFDTTFIKVQSVQPAIRYYRK